MCGECCFDFVEFDLVFVYFYLLIFVVEEFECFVWLVVIVVVGVILVV